MREPKILSPAPEEKVLGTRSFNEMVEDNVVCHLPIVFFCVSVIETPLFLVSVAAICLPGCNLEHGYCDQPNECK